MDLPAIAEFFYRQVLPWAAPPLLGAVIGYLTNDIAIRMLFRPLGEKRLLGLRLPFTPGVIPRQRHELAESIGRMVSRELITPEAVQAQLAGPVFRERLEGNVQSLLAELLEKPLAELEKGQGDALLGSLEGFLADALAGFFRSRSFIHGARALVAEGVRRLSGLGLGELQPGGQPQEQGGGSGGPSFRLPGLGELVAERLLPLATSPENRRQAARAVRRWLEARRAGGGLAASASRGAGGPAAGGQSLAPEVLQALGALGGLAVPPLLESLLGWLEHGRTRAELERRGKELLREILDKLNVLQKFLVTAGQFDRRLEQKMPEIVGDSLRALREYAFRPQTLDRLKELPGQALERLSSGQAAGALAGVDPREAEALVERALATLDAEGFRRRLARAVQRWARGRRGLSLGELARRLLGLGEEELTELASTRLLEYLGRPESSRAIAAEVIGFSRRFLAEHRGEPLGALLRVDGAARRRAGAWLSERLLGILARRIPALIESFDIHRLVVDKVNALDVRQVERLLLMVIARELKWINMFGALLGALIGFSQLALRLLR